MWVRAHGAAGLLGERMSVREVREEREGGHRYDEGRVVAGGLPEQPQRPQSVNGHHANANPNAPNAYPDAEAEAGATLTRTLTLRLRLRLAQR